MVSLWCGIRLPQPAAECLDPVHMLPYPHSCIPYSCGNVHAFHREFGEREDRGLNVSCVRLRSHFRRKYLQEPWLYLMEYGKIGASICPLLSSQAPSIIPSILFLLPSLGSILFWTHRGRLGRQSAAVRICFCLHYSAVLICEETFFGIETAQGGWTTVPWVRYAIIEKMWEENGLRTAKRNVRARVRTRTHS